MARSKLMIPHLIDWLLVTASITIALLLSHVNPDFHTFCPMDMSISHPHRAPKLTLPLLLLLALLIPILVIVGISLFAPSHLKPTYAQRFHHLNTSLLGLGVSIATSTIVLTGMKNLTGKPRPNMLSICDPDLEQIGKYTVGGFGARFDRLWVMVDVEICRQVDKGVVRDAFRSFPSGYATIAFAGLWYPSLILCHRFNIAACRASEVEQIDVQQEAAAPLLSNGIEEGEAIPQAGLEHLHQKEGFQVYFLLLPYIPLGLAIFIAGTRYFDFRNHGFDVLAGAAIGATTAWLGFRLFHPPLGTSLK